MDLSSYKTHVRRNGILTSDVLITWYICYTTLYSHSFTPRVSKHTSVCLIKVGGVIFLNNWSKVSVCLLVRFNAVFNTDYGQFTWPAFLGSPAPLSFCIHYRSNVRLYSLSIERSSVFIIDRTFVCIHYRSNVRLYSLSIERSSVFIIDRTFVCIHYRSNVRLYSLSIERSFVFISSIVLRIDLVLTAHQEFGRGKVYVKIHLTFISSKVLAFNFYSLIFTLTGISHINTAFVV